MTVQFECPKCRGEMVQGFIPDFDFGTRHVTSWREGPPKKSFWTKTKAPLTEGLPIAAFRCNRCGYVELYARGEFAAE